MKLDEPETIALSALNALEYCPRRFYYEFVQGDMLHNEFVLEGSLLHERVDQPGQHTEREGEQQTQYYQHLYLSSEPLHLSGMADLIEEERGHLVPVEYKHGKEGRWLNDHVQLCAQAMCLEERCPEYAPIAFGYIYYYGSRKRVQVPFTEELRTKTHQSIAQALHLARQATPPPPLTEKRAARCRDCSLRPLCLPDEVLMLQHHKGDHDDDTLSD
jgi:CRISPR-associated exonuclease Cas4